MKFSLAKIDQKKAVRLTYLLIVGVRVEAVIKVEVMLLNVLGQVNFLSTLSKSKVSWSLFHLDGKK